MSEQSFGRNDEIETVEDVEAHRAYSIEGPALDDVDGVFIQPPRDLDGDFTRS